MPDGGISHSKRHRIDSPKDHKPVPGDHDEDAVVVMDSNGLPVKDSGVPISTLTTGLRFIDEWDASGGTYPIPTKIGDYWTISVAGTIDGVVYNEHDWLVYATDTPTDKWVKVDNSTMVVSVEGRIGAVMLRDADIYMDGSEMYLTSYTRAINIVNTPPAHVEGQIYVVGPSPTGAWVGHTNQLVISRSGAWVFITPKNGWIVCLTATSIAQLFKFYNGIWHFIEGSMQHEEMMNLEWSNAGHTIDTDLNLNGNYPLLSAISKMWARGTAENLLATPPVSPITNGFYLVQSNPTGAWIGHAGQVAFWNGSAWSFTTPEPLDVWTTKATANLYRTSGSLGWSLLWTLVSWTNLADRPTVMPSQKQSDQYWISDQFGSDANGDGGIDKPFKTIQKAVDVIAVASPNTGTEIIVCSFFPTGGPTVEVPSGMDISIINMTGAPFSVPLWIDLKLHGFTLVRTVGITLNSITEMDSDPKILLVKEADIGTIIPSTPKGIDLILEDVFIGDPTTLGSLVNSMDGWIRTQGTSGVVLQSIGDPSADNHLAKKKTITSAIATHTSNADAHHDKEHAHDGSDGSGTVDHDSLDNVSEDQHHPQSHAHDGSDGSGTVSYPDLTDKLAQATESVMGIAELSTQAEADAGTDDLTIMTPLKSAKQPEFVQGGEVAGPVLSTSGTFALAGTITKTTTAGAYKLNVCAEMLGAGISSPGMTENHCIVEVRVDGTAVLTFTELGTLYGAHSGIALLTLTASSHAITFYIRRSSGGTVGIQNMRACLSKVVVS